MGVNSRPEVRLAQVVPAASLYRPTTVSAGNVGAMVQTAIQLPRMALTEKTETRARLAMATPWVAELPVTAVMVGGRGAVVEMVGMAEAVVRVVEPISSCSEAIPLD